jgi:hypothetical protein
MRNTFLVMFNKYFVPTGQQKIHTYGANNISSKRDGM